MSVAAASLAEDFNFARKFSKAVVAEAIARGCILKLQTTLAFESTPTESVEADDWWDGWGQFQKRAIHFEPNTPVKKEPIFPPPQKYVPPKPVPKNFKIEIQQQHKSADETRLALRLLDVYFSSLIQILWSSLQILQEHVRLKKMTQKNHSTKGRPQNVPPINLNVFFYLFET